MRKVLYILIGPKGAGKTYIGSQVERNTTIHFLRVEPIWLQLAPDESGWVAVEQAIDRAFKQYDEVIIESLGAGAGFEQLHASLKEKYAVKLVKISTNLEECLRRVRNRDNSDHIPVSDEKVQEYNKIAASIDRAWDAIVDNNGPATDKAILQAIELLRPAAST
jgi:predicted ABC-type ATPase